MNNMERIIFGNELAFGLDVNGAAFGNFSCWVNEARDFELPPCAAPTGSFLSGSGTIEAVQLARCADGLDRSIDTSGPVTKFSKPMIFMKLL
jgi:hypothetical protein